MILRLPCIQCGQPMDVEYDNEPGHPAPSYGLHKHHGGIDLPTKDSDDPQRPVRGAITEVGGGQTETDEIAQLKESISMAYRYRNEDDGMTFEEAAADLEKIIAFYSHHQTEQVLERLKTQGRVAKLYSGHIENVVPVSAVDAELARLRGQGA